MIAGMLAEAGVWFGDNLRVNAKLAARGLYEDNTLHRLNRQIAFHLDTESSLHVETRRYKPLPLVDVLGEYQEYVQELSAGRELWGVKDPLLVTSWPEARRFYDNARIVAVHRARAAIVASFHKASGRGLLVTERMVTHLLAHFYHILDTEPAPVYHVDYGRVIADPAGQARDLLAWCQAGTDVVLDQGAAVAFVDPGLRTFDSNGAVLSGGAR